MAAVALAAAALGSLGSCKGGCSSDKAASGPPADAIVNEPLARPTDNWYGDRADKTVGLAQGWDASQIEWMYTTSQGSELMPYDIFLALEQAGSTEPFRSPSNMRRLRYLTDYRSPRNPDDLAVGFVRNKSSLGFTCAACHTGQINFKGTGIRIEGGPAMADFGGFMTSLIAAVQATIVDATRFDRFAAKVNGPGGPADKKSQLLDRLKELRDRLVYANDVNGMKGTKPYGFARLDAFGRIFNRALTLADRSNGNPANAPVSYPFLWDTSQHDYVQWNGLAPNANIGELQRNIGEVVGVFGAITIPADKLDLHGYPSSVNVHNLNQLAGTLRQLQSPRWPESILPAMDRKLIERGAVVFAANCSGCHQAINRADPNRVVRAQMTALEVIKTDPTMAQNSIAGRGKSGVLEGRKLLVVAGAPIGPEASSIEILTNLVAGILENNVEEDVAAEILALRSREGDAAPARQWNPPDIKPKNDLLAYKGRPLNGIWATAPFLHNGSVPSLWHLMLPAAQRPKKFYVGRLEFDPKNVGFVSDKPFEGAYEFDTSLPGNSSAGHEFGTQLSDADRWAAVEYMKSL